MNRILDKALLKEYRNKNCEICESKNMVSGHHLKTKGSGGHDISKNLMALCFKHHTEIHSIGLNKFCIKYPKIKEILISKNWEFNKFLNKWVNFA